MAWMVRGSMMFFFPLLFLCFEFGDVEFHKNIPRWIWAPNRDLPAAVAAPVWHGELGPTRKRGVSSLMSIRAFATQSVGGYSIPLWESSSTNHGCWDLPRRFFDTDPFDPQDRSTATLRSSPQSLAFRATRVQSSSRGRRDRRDLRWSARVCRICRMSKERPTVRQCCFSS